MPLDDEFQWRETCFIFFPADRRPSLDQVVRALQRLPGRMQVSYPAATEEGAFESLTVEAPDDHSAVEVSFETGDEVRLQGETLAREMRAPGQGPEERRALERLLTCDSRLDLMHFERINPSVAWTAEPDEDSDPFDPGALLLVLEALTELTGGIGVDPQSGTLL